LFALKKKLPPESANKADDFYNVINKSILEKAEYMGKLRK